MEYQDSWGEYSEPKNVWTKCKDHFWKLLQSEVFAMSMLIFGIGLACLGISHAISK